MSRLPQRVHSPEDGAPLRKYQGADETYIDYSYQDLEGCSFAVRGPLPPMNDRTRPLIACLGSAATFGRMVDKPYATNLAEATGSHVLNLGFGGARPETYLLEPSILDLCKRCDLVVLELMSARSYSSDLFVPCNHLGKFGALTDHYPATLPQANARRLVGKRITADQAYRWAVRNLSWAALEHIRRQLLEAYLRDCRELVSKIGKPTLLLWLSRRSIDLVRAPGSYASWSCTFPHFVDRSTVAELRRLAIGLVDISDFAATESPKTPATKGGSLFGDYYPSPAMHAEAALRLAAFTRDLPKQC